MWKMFQAMCPRIETLQSATASSRRVRYVLIILATYSLGQTIISNSSNGCIYAVIVATDFILDGRLFRLLRVNLLLGASSLLGTASSIAVGVV